MQRLSQFWQEIKRRNVVRRNTVYAATAFVILELISIVEEPMNLPEWTLSLVIVLLSIGFIVSFLLSWNYDFNPEGRLEKTESVYKVRREDKSAPSSAWKIASYISFVVIVGLIVLNIIPRRGGNNEILYKSIAVLPFVDDSPNKDNEHIINGIMEDLLINLQSIKELRVPGRTSSEQYRDNPKLIPEIAAELNVAYIVEGSGQRYGNRLRLRVQLVEGATDRHIWADSYDDVINGPEDIFRIQSEIAQSIAAELRAVITPEEKQLIEKIPTTNQTAYEFYQKGKEAQNKFRRRLRNIEALEEAELLYNYALEYDSTYAPVYKELASILLHRFFLDTSKSEDFLDSALILTNVALAYDPQYAPIYHSLGSIYRIKGDYDQALIELDKASKLNPNDHRTYKVRGYVYFNRGNLFETISNLEKAISLDPNYSGRLNLITLSRAYLGAGFDEKARYYNEESFRWHNDSSEYNFRASTINIAFGDYQANIELSHKVLKMNPLDKFHLEFIAGAYMLEHQYDSAFVYYKKLESLDQGLWNPRWLGYTLIQNGEVAEGEKYIEEDFVKYQKQLDQENVNKSAYLALGEIYSYRGENEKAFEQLRNWAQQDVITFFDLSFLRSPLWDNIRSETEFQQIVSELEAKYKAEHEKVRRWLEENEML